MASLALSLDSTRVLITESDPPTLIYLLEALSHPSYGVRAAACQLTRALSRTVSLVRTSLIDCGIGDAIIETLIQEVSDRHKRNLAPESERGHEGKWGGQSYTVEMTAMIALSNLIADFSPLKEVSRSSNSVEGQALTGQKILAGPGIDTICALTHSPVEEMALNALWTIKNAMFKSTESMKSRIVSALGVDHLKQ